MHLLRPVLLITACLLIASLPCVVLAQSEAQESNDPATDNETWVSAVTAKNLTESAVSVAMAEDDEGPDAGDSEQAPSSRQERADEKVEAREDVGFWGNIDEVAPFNLLSFNIGLKLSIGQRPYKDVDTDFLVYPIISRFTDLDFTDQVFFCREGNCGIRFARNWYEFGVQGQWNGLGYSRDDSPFLAGMVPRDSSILIGPYVGLRSSFIQTRLMYFQDAMDNSDGSELRLVFDFPFRLTNGFIVPHIDFYRQDSDYTNYYYGIDETIGDRFPSACAPYLDTCTNYTIRDDSDNIDLAARAQFQVGKRWFLHLNARIAFLDDNITNSPLVDSGDPGRWWFGIGFSYDIDPTQ